MQAELYIGNTNGVRLVGLREALSDSILNNVSSVTGSLRTAQGAALGTPITLTFTYVSGSDGDYTAPIDSTAGITAETTYLIRVDVNAGTNMVGQWDFEVIAKTRRANT